MKKRILALVCAVSLVIGSSGINSGSADAATADLSLSKTKLTLKVKKTKTIKVNVKKGSKVKIKKQTFSSTNKKVVTVTKKGKITAKKAGTATIKVKVTYEKNKKKKPVKTLKCKVTVPKETPKPTPTPTQKPTQSPSQAPTQEPTQSPTQVPTQEPTQTSTPGEPSGKNTEQVAALNKIIEEQKALGAEISEDLEDREVYEWDEDGNLTNIRWFGASLKGSISFSAFPKLVQLYCPYNELTDLDISKNTVLKDLFCSDNQLTNLDVSNNTNLTQLQCSNNQLTNLDVSNSKALIILNCIGNRLTNLDVSKNNALRRLFCSNNSLTDLNVNTALEDLICFNNSLKSLDISKNTELLKLDCKENSLTSLDISNNKALAEYSCDDGVAVTSGEDTNMAMVAPIKFMDKLNEEDWWDDRSQTVLSFNVGSVETIKNYTCSYKLYIPKDVLSKAGSRVSVDSWFDINASEDEGERYIGGLSSRYNYEFCRYDDGGTGLEVYDRQENRGVPLYEAGCIWYDINNYYILAFKDIPVRDVIDVEDGKTIPIDTIKKGNISLRIQMVGNSGASSIVYLDDLAVKADDSALLQTDFSSPESMFGHWYGYLVGDWESDNWIGNQPFVKLDTTLTQMPAVDPALAAPIKFRDKLNEDNWWEDEKSQTIMTVDTGDDLRTFSKQYTYSYKLHIPKAALSKEGSSVMVDPWFDLGGSEEENGEYIGRISSRYQYWISNKNGSVFPIIRDQQEDGRGLDESEYKDFFTMSESGDFYVLTITDALVRDVMNGDEDKPGIPVDTTRKGWLRMRIRVIGNGEVSSNVYLDDLTVKGDGSVIWETDFSNMSCYYEYVVGEDNDANRVDQPPLVNMDAILK